MVSKRGISWLVALALALGTVMAVPAHAQTPKSFLGNWLCKVDETGTSSDGDTRHKVVRYRLALTDAAANGSLVSGLYSAVATTDYRESTAVGGVKLALQDGYYGLYFSSPDRVISCKSARPSNCSGRIAGVGFVNNWSNEPSRDPHYSSSLQLGQNLIRGSSEDRDPDDTVKTWLTCDRIDDTAQQ